MELTNIEIASVMPLSKRPSQTMRGALRTNLHRVIYLKSETLCAAQLNDSELKIPVC
jgi:hypothetical protein